MSKDRDGRVSQAQMQKLLDLLSADGNLQDGRVVYKNTNKLKFWKRIAMKLNSVDNGAIKNFHKWCKPSLYLLLPPVVCLSTNNVEFERFTKQMWADWKNKTKRKADTVIRRKFGNQSPNFTKLELRLLKLINYPIDTLLGVLNEEKSNRTHKESDTFSENLEQLENKFDDDSTDRFSEDNREFISLGVQDKKDLSHNYDIFGRHKKVTESGEANIKVEAERESSNMETLEDYKAKVHLALEKERIHQKSEELKLKALELKLKADELKLQETEVSRVNYLTELEEQKLKCMTEIAASLKELVEFTRNGSTRFHNVM